MNLKRKMSIVLTSILISVNSYSLVHANTNYDELKSAKETTTKQSKSSNYLDPSNYTIKESGQSLGWILNGSQIQYYYFEGVKDSGNGNINIQLRSTLKYNTSPIEKYADVEIFKRDGNNLSLYSKKTHNIWEDKNYSMNNILPKSDFYNQKYIYIKLTRYTKATSDGSVRLIRVENPYALGYKGDYKDHWAKDSIVYAMSKGWVQTTDKFRPDDDITRAEFVKIVNRAFNLTSMVSEPYKDVNSTDWFYNEVRKGLAAGYLTSSDKFRPYDNITRQEASKIIGSIMKLKGDGKMSFKDAHKIASWAWYYVDGLSEKGIIKGNNGYFAPNNNLTRAEGITILERCKK